MLYDHHLACLLVEEEKVLIRVGPGKAQVNFLSVIGGRRKTNEQRRSDFGSGTRIFFPPNKNSLFLLLCPCILQLSSFSRSRCVTRDGSGTNRSGRGILRMPSGLAFLRFQLIGGGKRNTSSSTLCYTIFGLLCIPIRSGFTQQGFLLAASETLRPPCFCRMFEQTE